MTVTAHPSVGVEHPRMWGDVLCGVNGSRASYEAVRQAAVLAGPEGRVALLAVTGQAGGAHQVTAPIGAERGRRVLAHAERLAVAAGVGEVNVEADDGDAVVDILFDRATRHGLLAIGAPFMSRLAHLLVGGTATRAAHLLPTSLLVARRPPAGVVFGERMIVASDGSARSYDLVDHAISLAVECNATLTLVSVAHADTQPQASAIAAQVERLVDALGDHAGVRIGRGSPRDIVLATAAAERCSLIIVASRRLGGLRALGSLSERLVHDARCSVLVIRPEDLAEASRAA